ncbi:MAG: hypothetical protein NT085_04800 [candidate division SR1 bacterium]|nr:hypothetical protein [candidate division SR1 bacterium]
MKNFKKLFSIVAIVAMLGTAVPTATLGAASYSDELQGAYDYAATNGITSAASIDTANMYGSLTRVAMAKMMANYAIEVLGQTPDTTKTCTFPDVSTALDAQYDNGVTHACQLGLMGVGIDHFNPNGLVTRAEFGTTLSRALYGDTYNVTTSPYYAEHLAALKDADVMTKIDTPSQLEVRGYVMLMMQRADETAGTPEVCTTPENVLSCSLGLDTCPAECKDTTTPEVKAGSLSVSLGTDSLANNSSIPSTGTVRFASVKFTASSSSDVSLKSVELGKLGLASLPSGIKVWFEKDGTRVSGKTTFSSESKANVSFAPAFVIKAGSTEYLDLYVEIATSANQDLQFASTMISSSAEQVNGGFTTPVLRTTNYAISTLTFNKIAGGNTYNATANGLELGAFSLALNDNKPEVVDSNLKNITLTQSGNANLSNLSDIVLERNGIVVAKNPVINGKQMTFSSINDTIKDGTTANYYLKAVVNDVEQLSDTYQLYVKYTTDINAVEATTMFRNTIISGGSYNMDLYTVKGGDITFTRDTTTALSETYAAGTSDVVLMKGAINAKAPITLTDLNLSWDNTRLDKLFTTIYVKIGNSTFSFSPASGDTADTLYGTVTVDGKSNLLMYGKLKDDAPATSVKFTSINLSAFPTAEYNNGNTAVGVGLGSIDGVTVSVNATSLNVVRTDGLGSTTIAAGTKGYTVYKADMKVTQGNGVLASNIAFTLTGNNSTSTGYTQNGYLTLYVDGTMKSYKKIDSNTITFDGFNIDLLKNVSKSVEIKADFDDAFSAGSIQLTLATMNAIDKLSGTGVSYNKPAGATLSMATASATIAASTDNPLSQLLLSPSTTEKKLFAFKVTAVNDSIRVYNLRFTGSNLLSLNGLKVVDASGTLIADATTVSATALTFETINNAPFIAKDKSATYYVVANVNSYITGGSVGITLAASGVDIKSSNGTFKAITNTALAGNTHAILENIVKIVKATNSEKELGSSALKFTVSVEGKDSVLLTNITGSIAVAGYSGDSVKIYKENTNTSNLAFSGVFTNNSTVAYALYNTGNATVDVGTPVTYVVVLEGAIGNGANTTQDWTVKIKDIGFSSLAASTYANVGSFPMTETK